MHRKHFKMKSETVKKNHFMNEQKRKTNYDVFVDGCLFWHISRSLCAKRKKKIVENLPLHISRWNRVESGKIKLSDFTVAYFICFIVFILRLLLFATFDFCVLFVVFLFLIFIFKCFGATEIHKRICIESSAVKEWNQQTRIGAIACYY